MDEQLELWTGGSDGEWRSAMTLPREISLIKRAMPTAEIFSSARVKEH
jgi:hypothetical protein